MTRVADLIRRWLRSFFDWGDLLPGDDPRERETLREMSSRQLLDDGTFYDVYYSDSGIPREIPVRLRALFALQLGKPWKYLVPTDNAADVCADVDFAEIVFEAEEEFGIKVSRDEIQQLDGTFDTLVKLIARTLQ